jgi:hypothetical protein
LTSSKGSLNIKDYPFAFSVAALLFPPIVNSGNETTLFFSIAIVGGMLGSLLTILNPIGLIIRAFYLLGLISTFKKLRITSLTNGIIKKNYRAALSSPSIAYETDKMVGMFYFIAVLGFAIFRFSSPEFLTQINLDSSKADLIIIGASIGIIAVTLVLLFDVIGFKRLGFRSVSHIDRIRAVTSLNMAADFDNLSNEGRRVMDHVMLSQSSLIIDVLKELNSLQNFKINNMDEFNQKFSVSKIKEIAKSRGISGINDQDDKNYYDFFNYVKEMSFKYDISFSNAMVWFLDGRVLSIGELDNPSSLLQSSIDTRDWQNADMKSARITERLEELIKVKNLPDQITFA